jgi:hypothetical protein
MKWLIALLLLAPLVQGISLGTDPTGDVVYRTNGVDFNGKEAPTIDLMEATFVETEETLDFTVTVSTLEGDQFETSITDSDKILVNFTYDGSEYTVSFWRTPLQPFEDRIIYRASLSEVKANENDFIAYLDMEVVENSYKTSVPRGLLQDENGTPLRLGHSITDFSVASISESRIIINNNEQKPLFARDEMPSTAAWVLEYGLEQLGTILLDSDRPVRVSNGEATTFLYELSARNEGDTLERFQLSTENVPEAWTVTLPDQVIAVEAGQKLDFPVLVTVPFRHEHGILEQLTLKATSQTNPENVGAMELGVRYTDTPQPAGHHNQLFLHNLGEFGGGIMNTDPEISGDENLDASSTCSCERGSISRYTIRLSPSLEIGLDFDMDAVGSLGMDVQYTDAQGSIALEGYLAIQMPGEQQSFFEDPKHVLAMLPRTEAQGGSDQLLHFVTDIVPTEFGDYWPYQTGSQLVLVIDVLEETLRNQAICCLGQGSEELIPGAVITLPLLEYHDDVSSYFTSLSGLNVLAVTSQKQSVNPGETAVFEFDVENSGSGNGNYELSLTGEPIEWAELLGATEISVPGKDIRRVAVAIHAPADATDGAQADITLHAVSSKDPNTRSLVRVLATVDSAADLPDQAARASELAGELQEEAPFAFILPILAIALVFRHNR